MPPDRGRTLDITAVFLAKWNLKSLALVKTQKR